MSAVQPIQTAEVPFVCGMLRKWEPPECGAVSREQAIACANSFFDQGILLEQVRQRVAYRTESQAGAALEQLEGYLREVLGSYVESLGFQTSIVKGPGTGSNVFLLAKRLEDISLPTVLIYGHGDTTLATPELWRTGLSPCDLVVEGDRWYGRGTADNKGQHSVNLAALEVLLAIKGGRLGFNTKLLIEMGEEVGSPGLRDLCRSHKLDLSADVFIASDGPRVSADTPTLFLGARGAVNFELLVRLRDKGFHSGNWGGLLRNPGTVLASAISTLVDSNGRILIPELQAPPIPQRIREILGKLTVEESEDGPAFDASWGEPSLTSAERLYGSNALEVITFVTGDPARPQNAIPPTAEARLQLRFVPGTPIDDYLGSLRRHLDRAGLTMVEVRPTRSEVMRATRLDPDDPWATWAARSMLHTVGREPAILPNLGGSLPNQAFADDLGLPTLWIPHSYPSCGQHGPNEHMLGSIAREGLSIMTGLLWDLARDGPALCRRE